VLYFIAAEVNPWEASTREKVLKKLRITMLINRNYLDRATRSIDQIGRWAGNIIEGCTMYDIEDRWSIEKVLQEVEILLQKNLRETEIFAYKDKNKIR
jgi:hypothetical protein